MPRYEFEIGGKVYEVESERMPSAVQMRTLASKMGGAPAARKPASPDDFTDRPAGPQGSAASRFAGGAWDMINPVGIVKGVAGAVRHPLDTAGALIGAQVGQFGKARDAFNEGRYSEALGHGAAGIVPVVGPVAADIGEEIGAGDVAGGLGKAAGILTPMVAGKQIAGAVKGGAQRARAAVAGAMTPAPEVADAVRWALDQGVPVDAATASGNRVVSGAKSLADRTLGGAVTGTKAQQAREASMAKLGRNLARKADNTPDGIASVGATPETAGAAVREGVESTIKGHADDATASYAKVRAAERNAMPDDVPVTRKVAAGRTVDQGFIGHWLADDLDEIGYQAGGVTKTMANEARREGDGFVKGAGRVAGTPTQEMFHAAGVSGSRGEIAAKVRNVLSGKTDNPRILSLIDAMGEMWDGQRFDKDLLTDETLARTGLKRSQFKSPASMPALDAPGASKFFGESEAGLTASGTEPMQLAVPLAPAKEALRPIYERLMRKRELTGQLMGDEGRAAVALDALISGPDHAPLSVVDAALGDIKAAARGAAMPELRTSGQGLAANAVAELETLVQQRAKDAGVWDDLRAGRDATIAKWSAAETLDKLRAEPVQTFRMLTSSGDAAVERLREVKKIAPDALPKVGRAFLDDALDTATAEGGFGREAKLWADWQRMGDETKALLYPNPELRGALDKFFLVGKKMAENPNPSGSGYMVALGGQGAMLWTNPVSGVATVLGGGVLSKALNSPAVAKLLTTAMETPKTAPAAKSLAARLRVALKAVPARGLPAASAATRSGSANPQPAPAGYRP